VALVHFEITIESFRRTAALLAGDRELRVVDRRSGRVVLDKDIPQRIHQPLGVPTDHRFAGIARKTRGLTDIAGRHAAYERIRQAPGNDNDWVVVASEPRPEASLSHSLGGPPLALILLGLALAAGALAKGRRPAPRPAPAPG
jgi:hypothetical protein